MVAFPRPSGIFWYITIVYCKCSIVLKYIFQFNIITVSWIIIFKSGSRCVSSWIISTSWEFSVSIISYGSSLHFKDCKTPDLHANLILFSLKLSPPTSVECIWWDEGTTVVTSIVWSHQDKQPPPRGYMGSSHSDERLLSQGTCSFTLSELKQSKSKVRQFG